MKHLNITLETATKQDKDAKEGTFTFTLTFFHGLLIKKITWFKEERKEVCCCSTKEKLCTKKCLWFFIRFSFQSIKKLAHEKESNRENALWFLGSWGKNWKISDDCLAFVRLMIKVVSTGQVKGISIEILHCLLDVLQTLSSTGRLDCFEWTGFCFAHKTVSNEEAWKGKWRLQLIQIILNTLSNSPTRCRQPGWLLCFRDTNHVNNCFISTIIKSSFRWLQTLIMTNDIPDSLIRATSLQDCRGSSH